MFFELLLFMLVVFIVKKYKDNLKYNHIPGPSPWLSLPLMGHGYLLGFNPPRTLLEMKEKYGDIFRLDIGNSPTIWLCTYDLTKEAFRRNTFNGRYWKHLPGVTVAADKDINGILFTIYLKQGSYSNLSVQDSPF